MASGFLQLQIELKMVNSLSIYSMSCGAYFEKRIKMSKKSWSSVSSAALGKLPHKVKIVVAGNHELGFEDGEEMTDHQLAGLNMLGIGKAYELLTNCTYLCDREVEVFGLKIYGAPWHPMPGYSFYRSRGQALLHKWNAIPAKVDVLVTHTPPLGTSILQQFTAIKSALALIYFSWFPRIL